jgi:hypothetical protein
MIRDIHPGTGSRFFTHPGSRGQKGTGSRIRNTDLAVGIPPWALKITSCVVFVLRRRRRTSRGAGYPGHWRHRRYGQSLDLQVSPTPLHCPFFLKFLSLIRIM